MSEAQGRRREAGSEGSAERKMRADGQEPDTRRERRTSRQLTAKSISIKGAGRKSGGCASECEWTYLGRPVVRPSERD